MRYVPAALLLLAAAAAPGDDRPQRRVADARLQQGINVAIDRGIRYLESVQAPDGSWPYGGDARRGGAMRDGTGGLTALALYALAASGRGPATPAVKNGVRWTELHKSPYAAGAVYGTYSASLLVLALTRIDARAHRGRIRTLAARLAASQLESDLWTYQLGGSPTAGRRGRARPGKGPAPPARAQVGDNSNSQFAVLALWAAQSLGGARIPERTWERIRGFYERTQHVTGAWSYRPWSGGRGVPGRSSMTAAGLVSYVYATAALLGGAKALGAARQGPVARKGLSAFRARRRTESFDNYYFVYSLERVGTVLGLPIDEWYVDGARTLVRAQQADGSWRSRTGVAHGDGRHAYETSLALLFLSRATAWSITPGAGGGRGKRATPGFPDPGVPGNLERAFSYYHALGPQERTRVRARFGRAGPAALKLFVDKLEDRMPQVRATAFELLDALVERRFLFQPDRPESERKLMLQPIRAFFEREADRLVWDAGRERFVVRR